MSKLTEQFEQRLKLINQSNIKLTLSGIRRGVERETLRVNGDGSMAMTPHPKALGSALTHEWITTDFSESLLEFITPPEVSAAKTIKQLIDIHKFTYENIGDEYLWPMSMPCFIDEKTSIPIARYGTSNVAKMKEVYRKGLHNRYGSMMQVISGVHFNFSLPDEFWENWCDAQAKEANKRTISNEYFALVRNYKRFAWLIPYLFGASPSLCGSFIKHREVKHPFEKLGKGTLYLPYATSLRMSDLGYTSSAQADLRICYNDLDNYVATLREAMNLPASVYDDIPAGENGHWEQLNKNVLQIENELYSPIRPKQVAKSLEKPTDALADRGVSYLEIRSLDVNPFSPVGIDSHQIDFLDVFLLYCHVMPAQEYSDEFHAQGQQNFVDTVLKGRQPELLLRCDGEDKTLSNWAQEIFHQLKQVAIVLDEANDTKRYSEAVSREAGKVDDSSLCPSGRWIATLLDNEVDNSILGMELAKEYKTLVSNLDYRKVSKQELSDQTHISMKKQKEIEAADTQSFDAFIAEYFSRAPV